VLISGSPFANREAIAITSVGTAARSSDAQLTACGSNAGTALYGCVADVLNRLCYQIGKSQVPPGVKQQFDGAIYRLRRAVNKIQALSALTQARVAISGALRQARSLGHVEGGTADAQDFEAISALLSHASQLIQQRGDRRKRIREPLAAGARMVLLAALIICGADPFERLTAVTDPDWPARTDAASGCLARPRNQVPLARISCR
jgi:hypothetical protein